MAIGYIIAQLVGAILGFGLLELITPEHIMHGIPPRKVGICSSVPFEGLSWAQVFSIEYIATTLLVLVYCSILDSRNRYKLGSASLKIGFAIAALSIAIVSYLSRMYTCVFDFT